MMNCTEFKKWLAATGGPRQKNETRADQHMDGCQACRNLYRMDAYAESQLRSILTQKAPAADFFPQLEADIMRMGRRSAESPTLRRRFSRRIPAAALAALLLWVVINPFASAPITMNQVERFVAAEHLRTDVEMDVRFDNSQRFHPWLSGTFDHNVAVPDLKEMGLFIKGGRVCNLAGRKAVFLVCERSGKKASLLIINSSEVGFNLSPDKSYHISDRNLKIEMWKYEAFIYVKVTGVPPSSENVV